MYKCPYCNKDNKFKSWISVRAHVLKCPLAINKIYYINEIYGPIHYKEFCDISIKEIREKYPNLPKNINSIKKSFAKRNIDLTYRSTINIWNKKLVIQSIINFYSINNRIPHEQDFRNTNNKYPSPSTVVTYCGSWNKAIELAGFKSIQNGLSIPTIAKDGVKYRSQLEAYFVNNYLYGKHNYKYEVPYNDGTRKLYDFYLPELDIYIEITAGLGPNIIKDKININNNLNRKLLVLYPKDIYNKTFNI